MGRDIWRYKKTTMSRLPLNERLWGARVSDPPVKAGAERKKKTVGLFLERGNPGWAPSRRDGNPGSPQPRSKALIDIIINTQKMFIPEILQ
jgi:hypothetical protein